jgi:hypothetical protein
MSTTVRLSIAGWPAPGIDSTRRDRPMFTNPVPAAVTAGGRPIGELDAYLQWDGDVLLARIPLPALPGHSLRAVCLLEERSGEAGESEHWINGINVTIDHVEEVVYGGFHADAPPVPAQRARVVDEKKRRMGEERTPRLPGQPED